MKLLFSLLLIVCISPIFGSEIEWIDDCEDPYANLLNDLMIVEWVNCKANDKMPVYNNHLLQGGYFNMPSALMGEEGEMGFGYSYVPPYKNYNLRLQVYDRIEISGNYRVFSGIPDLNLSSSGFGDFSDKGANIKISLLKPEESGYTLPGIAIGSEDFLGTRAFKSQYIVMTQVFRNWDLEASLGYGSKRIREFFGGFTWIPYRKSCNPYINGFAVCAEYDAIPYKRASLEPHPDGRVKNSPINYGIKYRLWDFFEASASYVRGDKFAFSTSLNYNFGDTPGLISKVDNPLPYRAPVNREPLGPLRPDDVLVQDLLCPLEDKGFSLDQAWLSTDCQGEITLRLEIYNQMWRYEYDVREQLNHLLAKLIPSNISDVIVVINSQGFPVQEYHFPMQFVRMYSDKKICPYELKVLSPLCDVTFPDKCCDQRIFLHKNELWNIEAYPRFASFFGSAKGKFKYAAGINIGLNGYLWKNVYYSFLTGYNFASSLYDIKDVDKLNPSQLINVRTDTINYLKHDEVCLEHAFIQKFWNMGKGWFSRLAVGHFEIAYGGLAGEVLWYPSCSRLAFGLEAAVLRKRTYTGIGFTDQIRKLNGYQPTHVPFTGSQYFVNAYYRLDQFNVDLQLKGGKFLANDWGVRSEICRYFPSGARVYFWYTWTNGNDHVNGSIYHDKGVAFSIPLDILFTHSSRHRYNYGISAWLRDVGAVSGTGYELFPMINNHRQ